MAGLDQILADIVQKHFDTMLLRMLGPDNCGLTTERVQELKPQLPPNEQKVTVDGVRLAVGLGRETERVSNAADNNSLRKIRQATLAEAQDIVVQAEKHDRDVHMDHPAHAVPGAVRLDAMEAHAEPDPPPFEMEPPRKIPPGMSGPFADLYTRHTGRIGEYCKGLGSAWIDETKEWLGEKWQGDKPAFVPDEDERQRKIRIIREEVLKEMEGGRSPKALAARLSRMTGDMGRNWHRIAMTELQACMNEATFLQAYERRGESAQVARVPESRACTSCRDLFLDAGGLPKVWNLKELLKNGTNVGKKREDWKATLYPIHPKCACACIAVPPGMRVDSKGMLTYASKKERFHG